MSCLREPKRIETNNLRAVKFDNTPSEIPLHPGFPVAPPGTPSAPNTLLPDVHITPATSLSFPISPPLPQEEGFLAVPARTSRGRCVDVSPRKLPTPPGPPPSYSVQEAERRRRTNGASYSSTNEPLSTPDLTTDDIVMALLYADSVVPPDDESPSHDDTVGPQERGSDIVNDTPSITASSNSASEPRDGPFTISDTLVEEIRGTTADTEFLEELGLSADEYMQLLEVVDFVLDAKDEDED